MASWAAIAAAWNRFFFDTTTGRRAAILRIGFATLMLLNWALWGLDLPRWFGAQGVLPLEDYGKVLDPDASSALSWLATSDQALWACYACLGAQLGLLGIGAYSRLQALCVFFWLVAFQHRHMMMFDAEDVLFRLLAFYLILLPAGRKWSVDAWLARRRNAQPATLAPIWPLRLVQLQMTLIYASTALEKLSGSDWLDGNALYYVTRTDDLFGRFWVPTSPLDSAGLLGAITWLVLGFEVVLPAALWIKETRRLALLCALGFHLALDYSMNLFLFEWAMILGLSAFVSEEDWIALKTLWTKLQARLRHTSTPSRA